MKKSEEFTKNGAIILGLGNGFLNLVQQWDEMNKNPNLKFKWVELFTSLGRGAIAGGSIGFGVGWVLDYQNSKQRPIDINSHLNNRSRQIMLSKSDRQFINLQKSVNKISKAFSQYFGDKIKGELIPHGSTEKGTALNYSFDIDIAVPFYPKSFLNNEDMYGQVYRYFDNRIGESGIIDIRKQRRSIGVCILVDDSEYWVDFAPYKLSKKDGSSGYLYVNRKGFLIDNSTIQKTDLTKLKKNTFSNVQKRIIVLLKEWKRRNYLPLPSHFLEHLVKDAYRVNNGRLPNSIEKKMIMVLKHMADKLHIININGDENTNNVISNSIDEYEKQIVIDACKKAIQEYEYQPNSLVKNFI